ncbi:BRI1 kinase inhibitor 1 [Solanum dulcamara]|uniref:BRI1 kinase inhibitor 1 n=1 Tax=Solanum dulcamara TaxID=45834 RepID=UPI002486B3C3|nr:BRI1 kinase inhibitor 1 [Solanum dulcamara]
MDNQQHQNMRTNQENDHQNSSPNSSSPSHEFSFTISFQQTKQIPPSSSSSTTTTTTTSSSFAIDLSPADDIFFHGHLLPLHLLSHLPISSPRSSTNSLDGFTLPKKDHHFFHQQEHKVQNSKNQRVVLLKDDTSCDSKGKPKTKSFSLFGIPKWRKGYEVKDQNKERSSQQYSKKMSQVVKRYIKMVRPFLSFRNKKNMQFHSFSGNLLKGKNNKDFRGILKEQYSSAPASIRTSPTNSGLLVATPTGGGGGYSNYTNSSYSSRDSTMEELQAAIQSAIAHCKKSISMED